MNDFPSEQILPRCSDPVVKALDIAHVRFARPDLDKATNYFTDFGLLRSERKGDKAYLYTAASFGPSLMLSKADKPGFLGFGLVVDGENDLKKLATLPGASAIEPAELWPEGKQVRLTDPCGNEVRALAGPWPDTPAVREAMRMNLVSDRDRVNDVQRPEMKPSTPLRLGHCVLNALEFNKTARWYMDTFGLVPSDIQVLEDGKPALVFMRCDRGGTPTDHHTVVVAQGVENGYSHSAFEVIDMDDIAMGQEHMHSRGWKHAWGIGRHLLGSQLFDYWRDPWGDKFEHMCDSDLFTAERPADVTELTMAGLYQWGPPVPHDFEAPKMSPGFILKVIRNIRKSEEMTFSRLFKMLKVLKSKPRDWS